MFHVKRGADRWPPALAGRQLGGTTRFGDTELARVRIRPAAQASADLVLTIAAIPRRTQPTERLHQSNTCDTVPPETRRGSIATHTGLGANPADSLALGNIRLARARVMPVAQAPGDSVPTIAAIPQAHPGTGGSDEHTRNCFT